MADQLQYNITDWHQLTQCHSNLSRDLSIKVSNLVQNNMLTGIRIAVVHLVFGTIFATVVTPIGTMVSPKADDPEAVFTLTTDQILQELYKWGFIVTYEQVHYLPADQLEYLEALNKLGYDKIRNIAPFEIVRGQPVYKTRTIAFVIDGVTAEWLNNTFQPAEKYYNDELAKGKAIDIGAISKEHHWDWTWLTNVASISDILAQNVGGSI